MKSLDRDAYAGSWTTLQDQPAGIMPIGGVPVVASIIVGGCKKIIGGVRCSWPVRDIIRVAKHVMAKFPLGQRFYRQGCNIPVPPSPESVQFYRFIGHWFRKPDSLYLRFSVSGSTSWNYQDTPW